jgi:uncharacterized protein YkwD
MAEGPGRADIHGMFRGLRGLLALAASLALLVAVVPGSALAAGKSSKTAVGSTSATAALDLGVLEQLNQIRTEHGLSQLSLSPSLSAAARAHSQDMLANGFFAHNSANGAPFWKRIQGFYAEGSFGYWSVGENLYWSSGSTSATEGMKAWMASPEHRANILNPSWRQIGIAAVSSPDAPGTYLNLGVTVITTDFGVRR